MADLNNWEIPSNSWIYRKWKDKPEIVTVTHEEGKNSYESKLAPYVPRDHSDLDALQVVCGDHLERDVSVHIGDGVLVRPWLTPWICLRTGLIWGWYLSETPNSEAIGLAYADGISKFGAQPFSRPEDDFYSYVYTDQGKSFRSHNVEGKTIEVHERTTDLIGNFLYFLVEKKVGIIDEFKVNQLLANKRNPKEKPVERLGKDLSEWESKILDETIDAEQVLRGAIVPKSVSERPPIFPICIDWNNEMYKETETRFKFKISENEFEFYNSDLVLIEASEKGDIKFGIEAYDKIIALFELQIFRTEQDYDDFRIVKTFPEEDVFICYGRQEQPIEKFFYKYTPEIWFADGSVLEGVSFCELKEEIEPYEIEKVNTWNWNGIDLSKEAQRISPKLTDSIQFRCIENLKKSDYDIIYDDDYSGEIADVIAMKIKDEKIQVDLFHLKYAKDGVVSSRIDNLYEVCGQAQKSVHWKFKEGRDFVDHLLRRKTKKRDGQECSRIEKGAEENISNLTNLAKRKFPMNFKIHIVQPSITRKNLTQDQLTLLAVTENYLKAKGIEFEVIGNDVDG